MRETSRRGFVETGCGLTLLAAPVAAQGTAASADQAKPASEGVRIPANAEQVINVLKWVDQSGDESLRSGVFSRSGRECFYCRKLDPWALKFRANIEGLAQWVNEGHSRSWEKIEYDKAAGTLKVTSRKSPRCVGAWAQCQEPPKSLCTHCCRAFQTGMFRFMFEREVDVEVTESLLLGGECCRTTVRVVPA